MSATLILTRDGDTWTPAPQAKGPFSGQPNHPAYPVIQKGPS